MNTSIKRDPFAPFWESNPPDFVNEAGVKWWLDRDTTKYATKPNLNGTKLDGYKVWVVQKPDGYTTRIIVDDENNPIYEATSLETIAGKIDILKLVKERCGD